MSLRFARPLAIASIAICALAPRPVDGRGDPWRGLARKIMAASRPDSTAVLVLFDEDVLEGLRSRLPASFVVVPFQYPDVPAHELFTPAQRGQIYREVSAATRDYPEAWIVGRLSGPEGRVRAARLAESAAAVARLRVFRDSVRTALGTVGFSRWVDRPGGRARRAEMHRTQAYVDSVMAHGIPKPIPITRPFTASELEVDRDTLSFYVARLADTSFYSIGGCSEVEIVFWNAAERLGQMGPGVLPTLVRRIADPDPFVRERVQEALLLATQDERILARTNGEYLKYYDQPATPRDVTEAWWSKFGHFWAPADSTR